MSSRGTVQETQQITPRIMVTTDFSQESERAFYHALAFAVARQARLTLLHTGPESRDTVPWREFPGVRETLAAWGLLAQDAPRSAVSDSLHVDVAKMAIRDDDPRQGITDYLRKHPTDLLIMATEGRTGMARLINSSVAETVTQNTRSHTLMLPKNGRGLVDPATGKARLSRVLCTLEPDRDPRPSLAYLRQWLPAFSAADVEILMLHTGTEEQATEMLLPQTAGLRWRLQARPGDPVASIVAAADETDAQLVVMNTRGPLGLRARMRGSRTDKVLRALRLPLLSIPAL